MSPAQILIALREQVPELEQRWPATLVMDAFSDFVADRVRADAPRTELTDYFRFVEELACSGAQGAENLVVVDFLEAAPWGLLGVAELLGPATRALVPLADTSPLAGER